MTTIYVRLQSGALSNFFSGNYAILHSQDKPIAILATYVERLNAYAIKKREFLKRLLETKKCPQEEHENLLFLKTSCKNDEEIIIPFEDCDEKFA